MVQLEIDFLPLVLGFSIGTVVLVFLRLATGKRSHKHSTLDKVELLHEEDADDAQSPASPEPAPEPEEEEEEGASAAAPEELRRPSKARTTTFAALAFLALLAIVVSLVVACSSPALEPPKEPQGSEAVERPQVAAESAVSGAPGLAEGPQELRAAQAPQAVVEPVRGEVSLVAVEPQVATPPAAEQDAVSNGKVVTLNLTRQQMSARMIGGQVHYKSAYWGTINVGTPAVDYKVVFDTGSGHLILPSAYCHTETCRAHKRYRRTKSSTAKDINYDGGLVEKGAPRDQITVSFGTGEVTGVFEEDQFCLHQPSGLGPDARWSGCMPMRMILATQMSEEPFRTFHFDGVLGLGLPGLSQAPEFNFAHMMATSLQEVGSPRPNMFAVFLAEHEDETSEITLGGYARARMMGELHWNPVLEPEHGHWMLRIKSVRIDDEVLSYCDDGCRAVVDTGTSLMAVPRPAFPEIFELLRHEADPVLQCHGEGPKLHIELEDFTVVLEPHDYSKAESELPSAKPKETSPAFLLGSEPRPEMCKPMLMSMSLGPPVGPKVFVLGEPVLRKYYTVYDSREPQPRIGFARAIHELLGSTDAAAGLQEDVH